MTLTIGLISAVLGATLLYRAAPHQQLARGTMPSRPVAALGTLALVAGLGIVLLAAGPATSVYIVLTIAMLVWTMVPLAVAWLRRPRDGDA